MRRRSGRQAAPMSFPLASSRHCILTPVPVMHPAFLPPSSWQEVGAPLCACQEGSAGDAAQHEAEPCWM